MKTVDIRAPRTHLSRLIEDAAAGEDVVAGRPLDSPDQAYLTLRMNWREGINPNLALDQGKSTFVLRRTNDNWQIIAERRE